MPGEHSANQREYLKGERSQHQGQDRVILRPCNLQIKGVVRHLCCEEFQKPEEAEVEQIAGGTSERNLENLPRDVTK
jgi:hypothetical protein